MRYASLGMCGLFLLFRLKTGNIPLDDLPFEENACKTRDHGGTLGRKKSVQNKQKKERKLFQIKLEIEDKVASIESDIEKGKIIVMNLKLKYIILFQAILK